ncbi:transglutaminase-like domain-containing protein [Zafaria sp. Z1313]|uniref:transglutaminase-like domain-containing protein n=1 Tax=Zafaria sp. Z1313 TaxID=3423202 RepID=UPI003D303C53
MSRTASARIVSQAAPGTRLVYAVAAVRDPGYDAFEERLVVTIDGREVEPEEVPDHHGGRLHVVETDDAAEVVLDYSLRVEGRADPAPIDVADLIRYVRPSRYCESDKLLPTAYAQFGTLRGVELVQEVSAWVTEQLGYVSGSSRGSDGSVDTLLARRGVCRDFAHLVVSLLRAKDVPARLAAAYAPQLRPMDFHAVAEAYVDGAWYVVDATGLAPRQGLVRISTGADSSDTAFLSTVGGSLQLRSMKVDAGSDETLEDPGARALVQLR